MSLVIDAHNHIGIRHGARQLGADLIQKMDIVGVDKSVIFPFTEGNFTNDIIKEESDKFPERLIPYCAVNPWVEGAVEEIRRCVEDWDFKGLKLHPTINGYHLSDHGLVDPIFAAARDLHIPIIVHGASDLFNSPPEFAEMARAWPDVIIMMAHMGYFWSVDQAIGYAKQYPNLYLESSRAPIFEITMAVRALGPDKVIWGTDSPFVDYEWEFRKMERATSDLVGLEKIVGGNLASILHLEQPAEHR